MPLTIACEKYLKSILFKVVLRSVCCDIIIGKVYFDFIKKIFGVMCTSTMQSKVFFNAVNNIIQYSYT